MKAQSNIRTIRMLGDEVQRLQSDSKKMEKQMQENVGFLRENFFRLTINSLFKRNTQRKNNLAGTFIRDRFNGWINSLFEKMTGQATEQAGSFFRNLFKRRRQQ